MSLAPFSIQSRTRAYRVVFASSVQQALEEDTEPHRTWYLVDRLVAQLFPDVLSRVPAHRVFWVDASEENKSYERLAPLLEWLIDSGCRRAHRLVVVGGGVTQDIGCFVASVLYRGIEWVFVPTTLLAQCDSCIGSKSSLNVGNRKNQLGTYYPPKEVRITTSFLRTLDRRDIWSGVGEAVKLHLIDGADSTNWVRAAVEEGTWGEDRLLELIHRSLQIKKRFIEADEYDQGVRLVLNYGHTFGHAFEAATDFAIPHGIAVSLGMACATYVSERLGLLDDGAFAQLYRWLPRCFDDSAGTLARADLGRILSAMANDKKAEGDRFVLLLPARSGEIARHSLDSEVVRALLPSAIAAVSSPSLSM